MTMTVSTAIDYAATYYVPLPTRIFSYIYAAFTLLVVENPLIWGSRQGKKNAQADVSGPFYLFNAPSRSIGSGKAVMVAAADLKKSMPLLFAGRVMSPSGKPVANAVLDLWQADSAGIYSFDKYRLRGTFTTGPDGHFECLTVPPGMYGPVNYMRAAHIHLHITPPMGEGVEGITTQGYLCNANDPKWLKTDFVNFLRRERDNHLLEGYCIPSTTLTTTSATPTTSSTHFMDLPSFEEEYEKRALKSNEYDKMEFLKTSIDWWNTRLADDGLKIGAIAHKEYVLTSELGSSKKD